MLARALNDLARRGADAAAIDRPGPEWSGHVTAGDYIVTVAGRDDDARIVTVCSAF